MKTVRGPEKALEPAPDQPVAFVWMAISAVLFATMNYLVRMASTEVPWQMVATSRALIGALVAVAVARMRGASLAVRDKRAMWTRSAFGTAAMAFTFWALSTHGLGLGDTSTLFYLSPALIALMSPVVLGERAGRTLPFALAGSLVGVVLIMRPAVLFGGAPLAAGAGTTAVLALAAATTSACAMMALRKVGPNESAEGISVHFSLTAGSFCALLALPHLTTPSLKNVLYTLLAGVCGGLAQLAMTRAYALARAARVAAVSYLAVVASALLGWVGLNETPRALAIVGMALVIAGGLSISLPAFWARAAASRE